MPLSEDHLVTMPPFPRKRIRGLFEALLAVMDRLPATANLEDRKERWLPAAAAVIAGRQSPQLVKVLRASILDDSWADDVQVRQSLYRLAANFERIRSGLAVPFKRDGVPLHKAYAKLLYVARKSNDKGDDEARITYHVESGPMAGSLVTETAKIRRVKGQYFAMTGSPRGCGYKTPYQLAGLRCVLAVEAGLSGPKIERVNVTRSILSSNVTLARKRSRRFFKCPFGNPLDCFRCQVGANECELSVLPVVTNFLKAKHDEAKA